MYLYRVLEHILRIFEPESNAWRGTSDIQETPKTTSEHWVSNRCQVTPQPPPASSETTLGALLLLLGKSQPGIVPALPGQDTEPERVAGDGLPALLESVR
jgi:hypothetical protein